MKGMNTMCTDNFGLAPDVLELFSPEELGYYENFEDDKRWQKYLSQDDLENEHFASLIEYYYSIAPKVDEKDVSLIKDAYKDYLPSQIKMAMNVVFLKGKIPEEKQTLGLALLILRKDRFGSRETVTFNNEPVESPEENRRVIGFKEANISGSDIKKSIEAELGSNKIVDFDKLFRRK